MLFYSIITRIYFLIISIAASFNKKAAQYVKGRRKIFKKIRKALRNNQDPLVWFHCASLGEFEQARPVIEKFKKELPDYRIFLTFFSPSGYEVRKKYNAADYIFYLPNDSASNARKLVGLLDPSAVLFVKYEFWYFYLRELNKRGIPVISFSAIFRKDQLFFRPYGSFYRGFLKMFSRIFIQNEESLKLLESLGIQNAVVTGDTRFDRVAEICRNPKKIDLAEQFAQGRKVFVLGSVWPADMELFYSLINNQDIALKYIVAPHNIHENEIREMESAISRPAIRYSQANPASIQHYDVLIIDNIGMLSSLYQYGSFAYIGGAFGKGLHNTLEAATFGMPVFYGAGESVVRFREAVELAETGAAFPFKTTGELEQLIMGLLDNEGERKIIAEKAAGYVRSRTGATDMIIDYLKTAMT